jgi:DNA-binding NarL/FixJ family response regulator
VSHPLRVFHCDDSEPFCDLVRFWLEEHPDIEHVGTAHDVPSALEGLRRTCPDVVLLDTLVPPGQGRSPIHEFRAAAPGAHVVLYSGYPTDLVERGLTDGGRDVVVLRKDDDDAELVATLRALA